MDRSGRGEAGCSIAPSPGAAGTDSPPCAGGEEASPIEGASALAQARAPPVSAATFHRAGTLPPHHGHARLPRADSFITNRSCDMTNTTLAVRETESAPTLLARQATAPPEESQFDRGDDLIATAMKALAQARLTSVAASRDSIAINAILW